MEIFFKPLSGYLLIVILIATGVGIYYSIVNMVIWLIVVLALIFLTDPAGIFVASLNNSKVVTLPGDYIETAKNNGFFRANPFLF